MSRAIDRALINAASCGDVAACREALEHGANVHASNDTALWLAADKGHLELALILLGAGANVLADDCAALMWGVWKGHFAVARALIQAGGCLVRPYELVDFRGWNPDALSFMLETPGCLSLEDTERLRREIIDSSDARFDPLRQRLLLQAQAARTMVPVLEMP